MAESTSRKYPFSSDAFAKARASFISEEKSLRSDHEFRQSLSPTALAACRIVSKIRAQELASIWSTSSSPKLKRVELFPGMMFNVAKEHMEQTRLWKIMQRMPKGSLLHCHLGAMVDLKWVFAEALEEKGMCVFASAPLDTSEAREKVAIQFSFSKSPKQDLQSIWSKDYTADELVPVTFAADTFPDGGREGWIKYMQDRCSITQTESLQHHLGVDDVWRKLNSAFSILPGIEYYEPIMRRFLQKFFQTLAKDGVRWLELRMAPFMRFVLEEQEEMCKEPDQVVRVIDEEVKKFMQSEEGKDFWGIRMIWVELRHWNDEQVIKDMNDCIRLKKIYTHLISGYDLVGHEDAGRTLAAHNASILYFKQACLDHNVNIPLFLHAGECLGSGDATDHNLFDAILLGTRRLGHAFSLYKHPTLISHVKEKSILIESCPISNEVLRYTASILSHPLPALLNRGVKASLNNDDPAMLGQGTSGLTHDFWQALQGWEDLGLEGLGSLAQNSVCWSAFEDEEDEEWINSTKAGPNGTGIRAQKIKEWQSDWEKFCEWIVKQFADEI